MIAVDWALSKDKWEEAKAKLEDDDEPPQEDAAESEEEKSDDEDDGGEAGDVVEGRRDD